MSYTKIKEVINQRNDGKIEDGEALDELLTFLKTMQPTLRKLIIETDGDELTDAEAIDMVAQYYHISKSINGEE